MRMTSRFLLVTLAWGFLSSSASAVEVLDRKFEVSGNEYRIELTFHVEAPVETVWSYLTDYDALHRYSEAIRESRVLSRSGDRVEVESTVHRCVLIFCRTIRRHEWVTEQYPERIHAEIDPHKSDLRAGSTRWELQPVSGATRLTVHMRLVPDFWVPPFIGPSSIRRSTLRETTAMLRFIERNAPANP